MTPPVPHGAAGDLTQAQRLARDAAAAAELRAWQTDPDVVALCVEGLRTQVDRLMWAGIVLGLCFTMTNVQHFAAAGAAVGSLAWCSAWLMDPMVSLVLLGVLRAEQVTTRYQVPSGIWPRLTKWVLLFATYLMNTWSAWAAGSASGVVLHSVPPLVVVLAAEAVTDAQHALTECVQRAHTAATHRARPPSPPVAPSPLVGGVGDHPASPPGELLPVNPGERPQTDPAERPPGPWGERLVGAVPDPGPRPLVTPAPRGAERPRGQGGQARRVPATSRAASPGRRKLFADYVNEARAARTPGVVISPAWVRSVTDCSRGLSSKVAAALNTEAPTTEGPSTGGLNAEAASTPGTSPDTTTSEGKAA